MKTVEVKLTPIPSWEKMAEHERQAHFRRLIREDEQRCREGLEGEGRGVMGPRKLAKLDHRERSKSRAKRTPRPLCHSSTAEGAKEYEKTWRAFLDQYYYASGMWLKGEYGVEFPSGSFKAPLICINE